MILVKERKVKNGFKKELNRIYVNTISPQFQFKNKRGKIVKPGDICINLQMQKNVVPTTKKTVVIIF